MVIGAREEPAECADELLALLERGMAARWGADAGARRVTCRGYLDAAQTQIKPLMCASRAPLWWNMGPSSCPSSMHHPGFGTRA